MSHKDIDVEVWKNKGHKLAKWKDKNDDLMRKRKKTRKCKTNGTGRNFYK